MSDKTMTNEEVNRYIHKNILGNLLDLGHWYHERIPDYCSNFEALLPVWEHFGFAIQPSGIGIDRRVAWWYVGYTGFADRGDMPLMSPENPSVTGGNELLETIARACVKAHQEQSK